MVSWQTEEILVRTDYRQADLDRQEELHEGRMRQRIGARLGHFEHRLRIKDTIYDFKGWDPADRTQRQAATLADNDLPILKLWTTMRNLVLNNFVQADDTFHRFSSFPPEVRQKIWHFAIIDKLSDLTPKIIRIKRAAINFYDMLYLGYRVPWAQAPMQATRNIRHHLLAFFLKVCKEPSDIAQLYHGIHPLLEGSELVPGKLYFKCDIDTLAVIWTSYEDRLHCGIEKIIETTIPLVESLRVYIKFDKLGPSNDLQMLFESWKNGGEAALHRRQLERFVTYHPFTNLKKLEFMVDGEENGEYIQGVGSTRPEIRCEEFTEVMTRHFFKPAYAASSVPEVTFSTYDRPAIAHWAS